MHRLLLGSLGLVLGCGITEAESGGIHTSDDPADGAESLNEHDAGGSEEQWDEDELTELGDLPITVSKQIQVEAEETIKTINSSGYLVHEVTKLGG